MSVGRVLRFLLGIILAAVLLFVLLPFAGIPDSHLLPPAMVYQKAQGVTRGYVTGKYYETSGNPFKIGSLNYFLDYQFKAPSPPPRGSALPGPPQDYQGTVRLPHEMYQHFVNPQEQGSSAPPANKVIPLAPAPLRIKYEKSYPDINGIDAPWAETYQMGRSKAGGSNILSGWIMWVVVAIVLGYFLAMILESFMKHEDI